MKFDQLISYYKRKNFIKNYMENMTWKLVPGQICQFAQIKLFGKF